MKTNPLITTLDINGKRTFTLSFAGALMIVLMCLAQSARAQATYTYTGNPFSYIGTNPSYGPEPVNISGYFTVASLLAPDSTYDLSEGVFTHPPLMGNLGGTLSDFSFTDGRYTANLANAEATDSLGGGSSGSTVAVFQVTTGSNGAIASWYINVISPNAYISTFNGSYGSYSGVGDNINGDAAQPYDAYIYNSPGTWAVTVVPEPGTLALAGLSGLSLLLFRHRK
jgi:hypothetical protein